MAGPLEGVRIIEMSGIGPTPFAGMMLADHGAEVIRIERPGESEAFGYDKRILQRSRRPITVDLKKPEGINLVRDLVKSADGLIEGYRPGVMERLGLGPDLLLADNSRLVYGRMTGWGQDGPNAQLAGHDINYIALNGALHASGRAGQNPTSAVNFVGDFGGGGMMLAFGMVSAILSARATGRGQVVDAAMCEGSAVLMSMIWSFYSMGTWKDERGVNVIDSGAHFYDTYETSDGGFVAVGAIEPQFYAEFRKRAGLSNDAEFDAQMKQKNWPALKERLAGLFKMKTRDEWCALLEDSDACFSPVLSMAEAPHHPHNKARNAFIEVEGVLQPAPAPRYSATVPGAPVMPGKTAVSGIRLLADLGYDEARIQALRNEGVIA